MQLEMVMENLNLLNSSAMNDILDENTNNGDEKMDSEHTMTAPTASRNYCRT